MPVEEVLIQVEPANYLSQPTTSGSSLEQISPRRTSSPYDLRQLLIGNSFDHALDMWPGLPSNLGINIVNGAIFSEGMLDLASPSSLSWNQPSDTCLSPQIEHFKDRIVLGNFWVISLSSSCVQLDTETIIEKRDSKAGPRGSALGRAYCMSILRSYPGMLCGDGGTLSSFIHPQSRPSASLQTNAKGVETLPEPLAICSSIMRMYMTRSPGTLAFIWRTLQVEAARMEDEVSVIIFFNLFLAFRPCLKVKVSLLRCLDNTCHHPSNDHIPHPRSPR
jgi:hypothetical protein